MREQFSKFVFTKIADALASPKPVEGLVGKVIIYSDGYETHVARVQHLGDSYFIKPRNNAPEILLPNLIDRLVPRLYAAPMADVSSLEGFAWSRSECGPDPYVRSVNRERSERAMDLDRAEVQLSQWLGLEPRLD